MQEIKKRRIVLASLLKPVDDTRMFEKLGLTLATVYEVYIIGQPTKDTPSAELIHFISLPPAPRLSFERLLAPWRVLRTILRIEPAMIIVCTAELLPVALCARLFRRPKIVYDVQENYAMNILHGNAWPRLLRPLLATAVRVVEWGTSWMISHYLLAEKSYASELRFIGQQFTVIENKVAHVSLPAHLPQEDSEQPANNHDIRLLFTGTLADTTGVFEAIELSKRLYTSDSNIRLHVVGFAAKPDVRIRLRKLAAENSFIRLDGIDKLVPHRDILLAIRHAHFGIISYPKNVSTWSAYPTKLYEYMGYRLPILLTDNAKWVDYCKPYNAAVVFSSGYVDADALLTEMKERVFYTRDVSEVSWENEAPKLLQAISTILSATD